MSANNIFTFLDWRNLRNGPEASAVNKRTLGLVPEHRKQILIEEPSRWITTTAKVAAINRSEANASLFIEIRKPTGTSSRSSIGGRTASTPGSRARR